MPVLTVLAGPNGSGKSSITTLLEFEGREKLLDPDAIARRIPTRPAVAAGREVITRTRLYLGNRESFALETTLSSASTLATMREARQHGFAVRLYFICLSDAEQNIERVNERASRGGHDVPDRDIRRRYGRSLQNLAPALQLADEALVLDNLGNKPQPVLETRSGGIIWRAYTVPVWVTRVCAQIETVRVESTNASE
ncbi:MAG TPA: AAA family ATPase [Bryobacteraceae bacterium]|jgi:predicted ABC-type ATPase